MRNVTLALLACVLAGCSALRLAYDNADVYLFYRANSYLDLRGREAEALEARIDEFFAWHRRTALPVYARLAEEAAQRAGNGLSREDLVWGYDALVANARQSLRAAAERIAPLLDRLTPAQRANLEERFAEDNRKFAREFLRGTETDRRKRRAKRIEQRLEDWVGRLSQSQVERVRKFSNEAPLYDELRARDRKRLQGELLEMVKAREAQARLPALAANWERGREPAYLVASQAYRSAFFDFLLDLDKTLTPEQRARAQGELHRYAADFRALSAASAAQSRP